MEVKMMLNSIPLDSSLGPDGFGFGFYLSDWDFVKKDLLEVAKDFFSGSALPKFSLLLTLYLFQRLRIREVMNSLGQLACALWPTKFSQKLL